MLPNSQFFQYNTLVNTNMSAASARLSTILTCMSQPARIQILMGLQTQEACVCHLETVTGMSQASISQHLMILRKTGLVITRRDGRHIYYSLSNPSVLDVYRKAAMTAGMDLQPLENISIAPVADCPCPVCNPGLDPKLICKKPKRIKPKF
jgi:DNA-binding transcriptional ArsR family regulator